jgi:hypothetical protein
MSNPSIACSTSKLFLQSIKELLRRALAVSIGVVLSPAPEILAGVVESLLRLPSQLLQSEAGVGSQIENVALSALHDLIRQLPADGIAEGLDHFEHSAALASSQVPGLDTGTLLTEVVQSDEMALGKILDVDVVANGSSVLGGVVYLC